MFLTLFILVAIVAVQAVPYSSSATEAQLCRSDTFANLQLYGASINSVHAEVADVTGSRLNANVWPQSEPATATVCNVVISYTHLGWDDTVTVFVNLPVSKPWNGRLMGVGGGAWTTGTTGDLVLPASKGFAAVSTDGGHGRYFREPPAEWAFASLEKQTMNWYKLHDYASVALDDAATFGKQAVAAYFGKGPDYSYWSGCSLGGRQGYMLAQRYPNAYDGIIASAPAISWDKLIPFMYWPVVKMNEMGYFPPPCELAAIRSAAIEACDGLDGVRDGIVLDFAACTFDPASLVGVQIDCQEIQSTMLITKKAVDFAKAMWEGPRSAHDGRPLWYGLDQGAAFTGIAKTTCNPALSPFDADQGGSIPGTTKVCSPAPFFLAKDWMQIFLLPGAEKTQRDLTTNPITPDEFSQLFRHSADQYASAIGTADPDLTEFKRAGGKMLTWHGTYDELMPLAGTRAYYDAVLARDPQAGEYYRLFEAPGMGHCYAGEGYFPGDIIDVMIEWVEQGGSPPDRLYAENRYAVDGSGSGGYEPGSRAVELCAYPTKLKYAGGEPEKKESWTCE